MVKKIYKSLRNFICKLKFRTSKKNIRFLSNTIIDKGCKFEGYNSIGEGTRLSHCYIGKGTYICENVNFVSVKIGRFCSLGSRIYNIKGNHPTSKFVSTHPCFFSTGTPAGFTFSETNKFKELNKLADDFLVVIGNDVWIGDNVTIKDGVTIGDGAIIGSNSFVLTDIEPYSINVGIPTRIVKYRFTDEEIKHLLNIQWWDKSFNWLKDNYNLFEDINIFKKSALDNN